MAADATPRRKAAMFASLTSDLRWRRPVPLGTRRLDYSLNNSRKLRPKTCDSQQAAICDRASRRHPARREVPLGTRGLGFSLQSFRWR